MPRGVPQYTESAALTFGAATTDLVNCGTPAQNVNSAQLAVAAWVYPTALTAGRVIISRSRRTVNGWQLRLSDTSGNLEIWYKRATTSLNYITTSAPLATVNQWYCVAGTFDTTNNVGQILAAPYGSPLAVQTCAVTAVGGTGAVSAMTGRLLYIGNEEQTTAATPLQGKIAAACLWTGRIPLLTELIAQQFSILDEPYPAVMGGCVGLWYPGNEGASKVIDYSGYHNDGTVTGATVSRGVALPARNALDAVMMRMAA